MIADSDPAWIRPEPAAKARQTRTERRHRTFPRTWTLNVLNIQGDGITFLATYSTICGVAIFIWLFGLPPAISQPRRLHVEIL